RSLQVIASGSAEREALRYAATRPAGLDLEIELSLKRRSAEAIRAAWDDLIRGRALGLDAMGLRQRRGAGSAGAGVQGRFPELEAVREQEAALGGHGLEDQAPGSYRRLLDEARRREEILERSLAGAPAGTGDRRGLDEVLRALPERSVLIAYTLYHSPASGPVAGGARYAAFVTAGGETPPGPLDLRPAADIDRAVERWRAAIDEGMPASSSAARRRESEDRRLGEELRRVIWDPVAPGRGVAERVFLVPEGSLNLVNFAALPSGTSDYL